MYAIRSYYAYDKGVELYNKYMHQAKELMMAKNHDYDEAWRVMRMASYTDLILMKIYRTKQIEDNKGKTLISEGVDANYFDMINYSVFGLIKLMEQNRITSYNVCYTKLLRAARRDG